jgi:hypothetical protein
MAFKGSTGLSTEKDESSPRALKMLVPVMFVAERTKVDREPKFQVELEKLVCHVWITLWAPTSIKLEGKLK